MKRDSLFLLCLMACCGIVRAENGCPPGMTPYTIPPSQPGGAPITSCRPLVSGEHQTTSSFPAQPRWEKRWGAIAGDGVAGSLGAVEGMATKRKAEKAALEKCRKQGGENCKVDLVYYDQCAVMTLGSKIYNVSSAATVAEATQLGMEKCNAEDTNCRVYYAACSLPERAH